MDRIRIVIETEDDDGINITARECCPHGKDGQKNSLPESFALAAAIEDHCSFFAGGLQHFVTEMIETLLDSSIEDSDKKDLVSNLSKTIQEYNAKSSV